MNNYFTKKAEFCLTPETLLDNLDFVKATPTKKYWSFNRDQLQRAVQAKMEVVGCPHREAAREAGVTASSMWRASTGKPVEIDSIVRICQWLGVTTDAFVERNGTGGQ